MIELAQWDTDNFGFKIGNLILDSESIDECLNVEIQKAKAAEYKLLYLKNVVLPDSSLNDDILLADEKVTYILTVEEKHYRDKHIVSYLKKELDVKLLLLALQSGGHSRYYMDKRIPLNAYLTLYRKWISNSLSGEIATDVLVYKEDDVLGLLTYKVCDDKVVIGLVDVDKSSTGKGIGTKMMQSFLSLFPLGTKVEVATQKSNSRACAFYEKNGFKIESIVNVYHIWVS